MQRTLHHCTVYGLAVLLLAAPAAFGELQANAGPKLTPPDGGGGENFGAQIALNVDTLVVGARKESAGFSTSGAAYIFERNQGGAGAWGFVKKLVASDAGVSHQFGTSVAVSGDLIAVGAPFEDEIASNAGAVYVFHRNEGGAGTWGQVAKLTNAGGSLNDKFGFAVAVAGTVVAGGALTDDAAGLNAGAVYLFEQSGAVTNWTLIGQRTASDAASSDQFGAALAMWNDHLVVGSPLDNAPSTDRGSVYIFRRDQGGSGNWGQARKILASDGASQDKFGTSVAIHANRVAVGGPTNVLQRGTAYVFERNQGGTDQWGEVALLTASDGAGFDHFGSRVAIWDDVVMVGAPDDHSPAANAGSAYFFQRDVGGTANWGQTDQVSASDGGLNDEFSTGVALDATTAFAGAPFEDAEGGDAGAAYGFNLVFNDPPSITDAMFEVQELVTNGTVVGTVSASDPNGGQSLSYAITAGNTGNVFEIGEFSGVMIVADATELDFESTPVYALTVEVTDNGTPVLSDAATITVDVQNELETADFSIQKTGPAAVNAGEQIQFTLSVTNHGPDTVTGAKVTDTLPVMATPVGPVQFTLGRLAAGESTSVQVTAMVAPAAGGVLTNRATVSSSTSTDPLAGNNTDTATVMVFIEADLTTGKLGPATLINTNIIDYTVTLTNLGPSRASNLILVDTLPNGVAPIAQTLPTNCSPQGNVVACFVPFLDPGGVFGVTVSVTVATNTTGTLINRADITFAQDPVAGNNMSEVSTVVQDFDSDGDPDFHDPDDDGDHMPDAWEMQFGLNPVNAADGLLDGDGDDLLNRDEYIADRIPTDGGSTWTVTDIDAVIGVQFLSSTGRVYTLEASEDVGIGNWVAVPGRVNIPGSGGPQILTDTSGLTSRTYRVGVNLP